tara:strand:+ start:260 stop:1189 length:930 start_codon:yes stop_codon:yes gene_type:complete
MKESYNADQHEFHDEIDVREIFSILLKRKYLISLLTTIAAVLSVLYALSLPNIYTSKALLAPSSSNNSTSNMGAYSSLAGLAGISLPGGESGNPIIEAMARIKSFDFFVNYFVPNIKIENLVAVDSWLREDNIMIYKSNIFDNSNGKWILDGKPSLEGIPSNQQAYEIYKGILSVSQDKRTSFVSMTIDHKSPHVAKEWLGIIIDNINESMREEERNTAINFINFLNENSKTTNINQIKEVISQLLESQMQNLMLASSNKNYIFKTLDSPIAPEIKSSPQRPMICILGTLFGSILSLILVLILHYRKKI